MKIASLLRPVCLAAAVLCGLAAPAARAADLDEILKRGKLVVSMNQEEAPPFFMHDTKGVLYGYDVELAQDIARNMGVALDLRQTSRSYDEVVRVVQRGEADVAISALSDTLERALYVRFTQPYLSVRKALVVNRLEIAHRHVKGDTLQYLDAPGVRIGVVSGSSYVPFAAATFPRAEAVLYDDWDKALGDVEHGTILAAFYDEFEVKQYFAQHPDASIYLQTELLPDNVDTLAFAVNVKSPLLLSWLNLYLQKAGMNGTSDRLARYYLKGDAWKNR